MGVGFEGKKGDKGDKGDVGPPGESVTQPLVSGDPEVIGPVGPSGAKGDKVYKYTHLLLRYGL